MNIRYLLGVALPIAIQAAVAVALWWVGANAPSLSPEAKRKEQQVLESVRAGSVTQDQMRELVLMSMELAQAREEFGESARIIAKWTALVLALSGAWVLVGAFWVGKPQDGARNPTQG